MYQVMEMTHSEKVEMYQKYKKEEIIEMLIEANNVISRQTEELKIVHPKKRGGSDNLYSLIDRLQKHSEWKYPNRKWTNENYDHIAFQWINKEQELERQLLKLEKEMSSILNADDIISKLKS